MSELADLTSIERTTLYGEPLPPGLVSTLTKSPPPLSREHWALQNTCFPLPIAKFMKDYGPVEMRNFADAIEATAAWLRFAGYGANHASPQQGISN